MEADDAQDLEIARKAWRFDRTERSARQRVRIPEQRKEPLTDASHVRNAIARFDQTVGVQDEDRELAFANIKKAAEHYGVDMPEKNWKDLDSRPSTGRTKEDRERLARKAAETRKEHENEPPQMMLPQFVIARIRACPELQESKVEDANKLQGTNHNTAPQEKRMGSANSPRKRDYGDKTRIALDQPYQVAYWKERFGVSKEELSETVRASGGLAKKAEEYLKSKHTR